MYIVNCWTVFVLQTKSLLQSNDDFSNNFKITDTLAIFPLGKKEEYLFVGYNLWSAKAS